MSAVCAIAAPDQSAGPQQTKTRQAMTQHCFKKAKKWINPRRSIQIVRMFGLLACLTRGVFRNDDVSLRVILFESYREHDVAQVSNTDWCRLHRNHRRRAGRLLRARAAFFVMNEFSTGGFTAAVAATNALIAQLAPR
jgi:hypothetical protein